MNWQWDSTSDSIDNAHKTSRVTARRMFLQVFIMVLIGFVLLYFRKKIPAILAFAIAFVMSILGLFVPSVFLALEQKGKNVGTWIAEKITWVILALVYFIFFVPGRLILVLMHKDTLERDFSGKQTSYWRNCQKSREPTKYQKQY